MAAGLEGAAFESRVVAPVSLSLGVVLSFSRGATRGQGINTPRESSLSYN